MDYSSYLPEIDVEDGLPRVVNNLQLYLKLIGHFNGEKMTGEIMRAIEAQDKKAIILATHALRGTAANLGFPVLRQITSEIEDLAKNDQESSHLIEPLEKVMTALSAKIKLLLEERSQN